VRQRQLVDRFGQIEDLVGEPDQLDVLLFLRLHHSPFLVGQGVCVRGPGGFG